MKKQFDIKKLVLLNLPYLLMGCLPRTSGKRGGWLRGQMLRRNSFPCLLSCLGRCKVSGPACTRWIFWWGYAAELACVWRCNLKSKNAKKYRHGLEYGSARWGTREDIAPRDIDPVFQNNVILTKTESLTMNSRPKDPKTARNKNVLVIGGSGSGKTRFWLELDLMQMHSLMWSQTPRAPSWWSAEKCSKGRTQAEEGRKAHEG